MLLTVCSHMHALSLTLAAAAGQPAGAAAAQCSVGAQVLPHTINNHVFFFETCLGCNPHVFTHLSKDTDDLSMQFQQSRNKRRVRSRPKQLSIAARLRNAVQCVQHVYRRERLAELPGWTVFARHFYLFNARHGTSRAHRWHLYCYGQPVVKRSVRQFLLFLASSGTDTLPCLS
jgi:hypothetical protein